jgi:hypothetical protein
MIMNVNECGPAQPKNMGKEQVESVCNGAVRTNKSTVFQKQNKKQKQKQKTKTTNGTKMCIVL